MTTPEFILPGSSGVRISLNVLWWWQPLYYFCKPVLEINGLPQPARWGRQDVSLPPGSYHLRIYFPYMGVKQCGPAEIVVLVPDGGWLTLVYSPPFTMFQKGKLRIRPA